jgi:hypothetical protein
MRPLVLAIPAHGLAATRIAPSVVTRRQCRPAPLDMGDRHTVHGYNVSRIFLDTAERYSWKVISGP